MVAMSAQTLGYSKYANLSKLPDPISS